MPDLNLIPPVFGYVVAGMFGAVIGSFLNVVAARVAGSIDVRTTVLIAFLASGALAEHEPVWFTLFAAEEDRIRECLVDVASSDAPADTGCVDLRPQPGDGVDEERGVPLRGEPTHAGDVGRPGRLEQLGQAPGAGRRGMGYRAAAIAGFACALLSKESAMTLLLVLALVGEDRARGRRARLRLQRRPERRADREVPGLRAAVPSARGAGLARAKVV